MATKPEIQKPSLDFKRDLTKNNPDKIIIHHTAVDQDQSAETIHDFHKNTRGWNGIGYNYLIRHDGTIEEGRGLGKQGAHAKGQNSSSVGIAITGNFDNGTPKEAQMESLVKLIKYIRSQYGDIPIYGHTDFAAKSCPGDNFPWKKLEKMLSEDKKKEQTGGKDKMEVIEKGNIAIAGKKVPAFLVKDMDGSHKTTVHVRALEGLRINVDWDEDTGTEINLDYQGE